MNCWGLGAVQHAHLCSPGEALRGPVAPVTAHIALFILTLS